MLAPWKKSYDQPRQHIKKQRHYFAEKIHLVKAIVFPVVTYGCDSWTVKTTECRRIDAFELWCWRRLLKVPLDNKIKPVNPKGNQSWIFIGRTDAEAPTLWPSDVKNWLIGKDPDSGKDWRQKEKRTTEDKMDGWHHWLDGHEFEQAPEVGDGQGSLACCSPWGRKSRTQLNNWIELNWMTKITGWCDPLHRVQHSRVQTQVGLKKYHYEQS